MTAVEAIQELWEPYLYNAIGDIPGDLTTLDVLDRTTGKYDTPHFYPDDYQIWGSRNIEISRKMYTRNRDRKRAYRQNDLRFARAIDRILAE